MLPRLPGRLLPLVLGLLATGSGYLPGQNTRPSIVSSDLYTSLDSALQTTQIVYLGEQSHRDGATLDAKLALVQYLYEKHGFTVLAFEWDAFALDSWNTALRRGRATKAGLHDALMPFWSRSTAADSLASYLIAREGRLRVAGFDNQLTTQLTLDSLTVALRQVLPQSVPLDVELLDELVSRLLRMDSFTEKDAADARRIQGVVREGLDESGLSPDRRVFWSMMLESLVQEITSSASEGTGAPEPVQNARDRQMAHNLLSLTRQYPGQKVICWGASYHFAKDLGSLRLRDTSTQRYLGEMNRRMGHDSLAVAELLELEQAKPMAQVFAELSSLPTLSLAFTAGEGYTDQGHFGEDTLIFPVPAAPSGSWEEQFANSGNQESIYVFTEDDTTARHLAALGYLPILANWSTAFDAVYYTPRMYPVAYLPESGPKETVTATTVLGDTLSGRVVDGVTGEPVPYAYIYSSTDEDPLLSNLSGYFQGPGTGEDSISVTAIGYATLRAQANSDLYSLQPTAYATAEVLVRAGKIDPLQIVRASVAAIPFNYPQHSSRSRFLWRETFSDSIRNDTLDAILRIHDRIGYASRSWSRVLNSRTARIDSLHFRSDWEGAAARWNTHGLIDVFGHDPLLTSDRPLHPSRFRYYSYQLLGTRLFANKKVFVIAFTNEKPNAYTAGTTHLKTHTGKLYINSDDFALMQYEEALTQRPYVREDRTVTLSVQRSFQYSQRKGKYVLSLVRVRNLYNTRMATAEYTSTEQKQLYLLDWEKDSEAPLAYPLMKLHRQKLSEEAGWDSERLFTTLNRKR